jgi:glutathione S-transferase
MIRISAFRSVPPFAQGAVRDFRVRWALEEAGLPYEVRLLGQGDQKSDSYRDLQPFGQVPSFEDGELTLFESGAIVLHIAEKSGALLPKDEEGRSRARTWVFAALNTVEPHIQELGRRNGAPWWRRWCASGSANSPTRWRDAIIWKTASRRAI